MGCIGIRKCIQRVFDLAVFRIIGILLRKSFLAVNIYWMPVQNQLKWSVLSFVHKFLQTFSLLIWVICLLPQYFGEFWRCFFHKNNQKQIIQRTFQKKKVAGTLSFVSWFTAFQWKKIIETSVLLMQISKLL